MSNMDSEYLILNDTFEYNYEDQTELGSFQIQEIVTNSILLYIGLCTNIWMLWSLYKTREVGSRAHFYLLALCIAETVGLCIYCSMQIGTRVTSSWSAGKFGCKILMALLEFTTLAHYILVGFNVDNIITVIRGRSTKTIRVVFLVLAVLCSVVIAILQGHMYEAIEYGFMETLTVCTVTSNISTLVHLAVAVGIPISSVCLFGGPSLCLWCARKNVLSQSAYKEDGSGADAKNIGRDVGLALALSVFFILCWSPYVVFHLFMDIHGPFMYYMNMYTFATALATANSCFNPLVYAVFNCLNRRQNKVSPEL